MNRLALPLLLVGVAVAAPGCGRRAAPAPAAPAIPVKASELLGDYAANAVAADDKYKGQVLQVTGSFGTAQKILGTYAVQLLPEGNADLTSLNGVMCVITESAQADVAKMKANDRVTLQGICDGQVLGQVKLTRCTVVK